MMRLWCPKCGCEFKAERSDPFTTHDEYVCGCKQLLQWDWRSPLPAMRGMMYGPPKKCEHVKRKNDNAREPVY